MGPAVECRDIDADQPVASMVTVPYRNCKSATILTRYQHYCQELAVLVLEHGYSHLQLSLRLVYSVNASSAEWLARHPHLARHPAVLLHVLKAALQQVKQAVLRVLRPIGRFLSQLVSIRIQISTNDDQTEQGKASARVHTAVSLLFGAIRFRTHSYLQLSAPSRQPQLWPEFSLISPSTSPYPCSSPRKHRNRHLQGLAHRGQSPNISPQLSPRRGPRVSGQQQLSPSGSQQLGAADSEVHVLCSSELRSAILAFLQHHSSSNGQDFVLLRSHNDSSSSNTPRRTPASSTAGGCSTYNGAGSSWRCSMDQGGQPGASGQCQGAAADMQLEISSITPGHDVSAGLSAYPHQSHYQRPHHPDSSSRLTQSVDADLCSNFDAADSDSFSFSASNKQPPVAAAAAPTRCLRSSWTSGSNSSTLVKFRTAELFARTGRNSISSDGSLGDAVVAVSIAQPTGRAINRRQKSCPAESSSTASADVSAARPGLSREHLQRPNAAACSGIGLLDPNLAPLMSYQRSNSSSRRPGSSSYLQYSMYADKPAPQKQQQQQPSMLPACPAGLHQQAYIGKECKPARSPSPIAVPARHGVKHSSSVKKPLPPPPFVLVPAQQ